MDSNYMAFVRCSTYNHSSFIEDAMNGFCMQQTNFPFVCAIVDDASTDGEQEVIYHYLQEHFNLEDKNITQYEETDDYKLIFARHKSNLNCYFVALFLKYNHYKKKPKGPYCTKWLNDSKYVAICEGDDYWTDANKLQRQVDFLEAHPDFTMVCNRTGLYSEKNKKYVGESYCYDCDCSVNLRDIIYRAGNFISTCSIVHQRNLKDNYPDYCKRCSVGDYPLQIMAAMKGRVFYFNDIMSVYRISNPNSWMGSQHWDTADEKQLDWIGRVINMLNGFSNDYPVYKKYFQNRIAQCIISQFPKRNSNGGSDFVKYKNYFQEEIDTFPFFWKVLLWLNMTSNPIIHKLYGAFTRFFLSGYRIKKILYFKK